MKFAQYIAAQPWAIWPEAAPGLADIAAREHEATPEALEAYQADTLARSQRAGVRDDVALLYVDGPLFKRANLMVRFSGATSYAILRQDLQVAVENPDVRSILLVIDSPGGEANGCDELAAAIFAARKIKPVVAYVSGMAASGGYWIASACSKIVVSEAALLGSIGVILGVPDRRAADERSGVTIHQFISSQSPGKRPDPATEAGQTRIQSMVDEMAGVFIGSVAKYRGVTADTVVKKFGGGGMLVGAKAVAAGMADEVGQFEAVIASLASRPQSRAPRQVRRTPLARANGGDVARAKAILISADGREFPLLAERLVDASGMTVEGALAILAIAKSAQPDQQPQVVDFETMKAAAGALMGNGTQLVNGVIKGGPTSRGPTWQAAVDLANGVGPAAVHGGIEHQEMT